jgi:hypothetical protein
VKSIRAIALRGFYNEIHKYLTSLMMQIVVSDAPLKLADDLRARELEFMEVAVGVLTQV